MSNDLIRLSFITAFASFAISFILLSATRILAKKLNIVDSPNSRPDKLHKFPIPLMGGVGVVLTSLFCMGILWLIQKYNLYDLKSLLVNNLVNEFKLIWVMIGGLIMLIGGILDDRFGLNSKWLSIYINIAILIAVIFGNLKIVNLSEPYRDLIPNITWLHYLLAYVWLIFCTAATKFMDGMDGLSGSFSFIGFLTIASISIRSGIDQNLIYLFCLIWVFALIPFIASNYPDAKRYLGESGAEITGFMIGVFSILSGAKIATASTLIGWFILDIILVFMIRLAIKKPLFQADRNHWHHRIQDIGLDKRQALILTILILLLSAHLGLMADTNTKLIILPVQVFFLIGSLVMVKLRHRLKISKN